jgi:malonyl-CoA O-methyltransferase
MKSDPIDTAHALPLAAVARSFGRASGSYDAAARLQTLVRDELLQRLAVLRLTPQVVLDLGAGTGLAAAQLKRMYPRSLVLAADLAPAMVAVIRRRSSPWRRLRGLVADARQLPLPDASVDVVFSSLMLQWCDPPDAVLAEARRVLRPGGLLLLASFGPDTLRELRSAWAAVDDGIHVNRFVDLHDLGAALQRCGYAEPVLDVDRHVLAYPDALTLMRELKAIGAHNINAGRSRALTGRHRYQAMVAAYERLRRPAGLPATYEVVYATAWAPDRDGGHAAALPIRPESGLSLGAMMANLRKKRR